MIIDYRTDPWSGWWTSEYLEALLKFIVCPISKLPLRYDRTSQVSEGCCRILMAHMINLSRTARCLQLVRAPEHAFPVFVGACR